MSTICLSSFAHIIKPKGLALPAPPLIHHHRLAALGHKSPEPKLYDANEKRILVCQAISLQYAVKYYRKPDNYSPFSLPHVSLHGVDMTKRTWIALACLVFILRDLRWAGADDPNAFQKAAYLNEKQGPASKNRSLFGNPTISRFTPPNTH